MKRLVLGCLLLVSPFALSAKSALPIERWQTNTGTPVSFVASMEVPMVDIQVLFKAGSAYDGKHEGLATLTNELLNQGAGKLDATELAKALENVGAIYRSDVTRDYASVSLRSLTKPDTLSKSLNTFATILQSPAFKPSAIKREKAQLVTAITHAKETPQSVASDTFYQDLYGKHPYAHSPLGNEKTLNAINKATILAFYRQHYSAKNAIIAITGAIDAKTAKKIANQLTNKLSMSPAVKPIPKATVSKKEQALIKFPSNQSIIRLGQLGIAYNNPDHFPLTVGNYTLGGGGLVSRLADEIREKRGLSYGISSYFLPLEATGPFIISLATKTSQTEQALSVTEKTLTSFLDKGPSDSELKAAKQYIIGSFPLRFSANNKINGLIALMAFYHLPNDYLDTYVDKVNQVSQGDIKRAFNHVLHRNQLLTVVVGQHERA